MRITPLKRQEAKGLECKIIRATCGLNEWKALRRTKGRNAKGKVEAAEADETEEAGAKAKVNKKKKLRGKRKIRRKEADRSE